MVHFPNRSPFLEGLKLSLNHYVTTIFDLFGNVVVDVDVDVDWDWDRDLELELDYEQEVGVPTGLGVGLGLGLVFGLTL